VLSQVSTRCSRTLSLDELGTLALTTIPGDREPVERLKTNPGFVVSSAERLILSEGPEPAEGPQSKPLDQLGAVSMSNGPRGGLFMTRS
jgi:hypothetical protein